MFKKFFRNPNAPTFSKEMKGDFPSFVTVAGERFDQGAVAVDLGWVAFRSTTRPEVCRLFTPTLRKFDAGANLKAKADAGLCQNKVKV